MSLSAAKKTTTSAAYFIPHGKPLTSFASALLLPPKNPINQLKPPLSSVPVSQNAPQNVANFLIATPTSSSLANQQASSPQVGPPVVYQIGNVLPITSVAPSKPQISPQNNSVKLVTPQMTYLIPISGAISPSVALKNANSSSDGGVLTSKNMASHCSPIKARKRRKLVKAGEGDPHVDSINVESSSSDLERRLLDQVDSLKTALRRKTSTIKELRKDKNRLSKKLRLLGAALGKLQKASMWNLSSAKWLEALNDSKVTSDVLDLKVFGVESKLGDVVRTIHYLSKRVHDHVKSNLVPNPRNGAVGLEGPIKVEPPW